MKEMDFFDSKKEPNPIQELIYEVHGEQVMFDSDLAVIYGTETKRINEAVRRHKGRFPERFCFRISEDEYKRLKSHSATSKGGSKKGHTVFTEQGVAMLSAVLKTTVAIDASVRIMDAFVALKKYISGNLLKERTMRDKLIEHDNRIKNLEDSIDAMSARRKESEVYFDGQIFDAYSKIISILMEAKKSIIIVDNYADISLLDIVKRLDVSVTIIVKKNGLLRKQDIDKYNEQYKNLKISYDDSFHDRYFIIDGEIVFHCGASINRIGYKTFSIATINDKGVAASIISKVSTIIMNNNSMK